MIEIKRLDPAIPVLYLDFDGVILVPEYLRAPKKESVFWLNKIIEETSCQIVFSTAHRIIKTLDQLRDDLERWGVRDCFVTGKTGQSWNGVEGRMKEVRLHARENMVKNWVSLDDSVRDMKFRYEGGLFICVDGNCGITESLASFAIEHLNSGQNRDPGPTQELLPLLP